MNQKMSYSSQQELKKKIADRLKVVQQHSDFKQQTSEDLNAGSQEHIMPDGMSCKDIRQKKEKVSYVRTTGNKLKEALVLSEIISEPVCKRRLKRRITR